MSESRSGRVTSIAINAHKLSFALDRKDNERFVLYNEAPNTQTIPQFEVATRSWMLAVLQTAFATTKELVVSYDDNPEHTNYEVHQIEIHDPLHFVQNPVAQSPIQTGVGQTPIKAATKGKGK